MRFALIAIPAMLVCGSAFAEGWQEYVYADYQFAVSFPDAPKIETGRFDLPGGASVPARIYSATSASSGRSCARSTSRRCP